MPGPVMVVTAEVTGNATGMVAAMAEAQGSVTKFATTTEVSAAKVDASSGLMSSSLKKTASVVTLAALAVAGASLKMAADFQTATTELVTGAGESVKNIDLVKSGLLSMAPAVGMGPTALAKAMFLVESAGFHGAAGLVVMRAAAEGAKVGGAEATVVANALTTAMTDYNLPVSQAAKVTSELVATVASGKSNMTDLAGSMSTVAPVAAAAGIGLNQMLGAMATMTGEGISAQQSAQDLSSTIRSLSNPTSVMTKEMGQMGLSSVDVAKNLGKNGLTGTMETMYTAVMSHMGPAGLVLQSSFNQSKLAAQSAQEMLTKLPASLQTLAKGFLDGSVTQKEWMAGLKNQPALTANLGHEFATTAKQANGFSQQLKSGSGSAATFNAIIANMTGGATGLGTTLALTGGHAATFTANVKAVGGAATESGNHVKGWAETQKDLSVSVAQSAAAAQVMAIQLGTALMPSVQGIVKSVGEFVSVLTKNPPLLFTVIGVLGALASIFIAVKLAQIAYTTYQSLATAATILFGNAEKTGLVVKIASKAATLAGAIAMGVATAAQWAWNAAITANPIGLIILAVVALVAALIWFFTQTKLGKEVFKNVTDFIATVFTWLWKTIIEPIVNLIVSYINLWAAVFKWLWEMVLQPVFAAIGKVFEWVYNTVIKPYIALISAEISILAAIFTWLYENIIKPVFDGIGTAFTWIWNMVIKPIVDFISIAIRVMSTVFSDVFGGIGSIIRGAFDGVVDFIKGIINSIVDVINGAIGGIDDLIKVADTLPGVNFPIIPKFPHFADGGRMPQSGFAVVGERGPEIVHLPQGAQTLSHADSVTALSSGNSGGPVELSDATIDKLARVMSAYLRVQTRQGVAA
jgi:TP901 family phage tail tape measure protein